MNRNDMTSSGGSLDHQLSSEAHSAERNSAHLADSQVLGGNSTTGTQDEHKGPDVNISMESIEFVAMQRIENEYVTVAELDSRLERFEERLLGRIGDLVAAQHAHTWSMITDYQRNLAHDTQQLHGNQQYVITESSERVKDLEKELRNLAKVVIGANPPANEIAVQRDMISSLRDVKDDIAVIKESQSAAIVRYQKDHESVVGKMFDDRVEFKDFNRKQFKAIGDCKADIEEVQERLAGIEQRLRDDPRPVVHLNVDKDDSGVEEVVRAMVTTELEAHNITCHLRNLHEMAEERYQQSLGLFSRFRGEVQTDINVHATIMIVRDESVQATDVVAAIRRYFDVVVMLCTLSTWAGVSMVLEYDKRVAWYEAVYSNVQSSLLSVCVYQMVRLQVLFL